MSFNIDWDIEKYRDDHESDEHWQLRSAFMMRWKDHYPEERLVCLARVFANMEFMGCRYPTQVMQEVAKLSKEVAKDYRALRKTKLCRTFVSASDAAEDRAKGIKREGGIIKEPPKKTTRIEFVKQGNSVTNPDVTHSDNSDNECDETGKNGDHSGNDCDKVGNNCDRSGNDDNNTNDSNENKRTCEMYDLDGYLEEMNKIQCTDVRNFRENMFYTEFGKLVLLIRPWASKFWNIQASCHACKIPLLSKVEPNMCTLTINGKLFAQATGDSRQDAKNNVGFMAWNKLKEETVSVLVKEQYIPHDGGRISVDDVTKKKKDDNMFGTPVENSVAMKMMKMMGWKGGGLGADSQGIEEPIKPHFQMVNRSGLGSSPDISHVRRAAHALMRRYLASDTLDVDLVFSAEFSKDERAALHKCAASAGLASRSYSQGGDRFLVVKKKIDPFSIVKAVIEKGGNTPKYQVFIPEKVRRKSWR